MTDARAGLRLAQGLAKLLVGAQKFTDQRLQRAEPEFEFRAGILERRAPGRIQFVAFVHRYSGAGSGSGGRGLLPPIH